MKKLPLIGLILLSLTGARCIKPTPEPGRSTPRQDFPFVSATPAVDTSNWKTFTDTKVGYSFKYPAEWGVPNDTQVASRISVTVTDPVQYRADFTACPTGPDPDSCILRFVRTPDEVDAMVKLVTNGTDQNQANYTLGCHHTTQLIRHDGLRAAYYCGYDVAIDNYTYYAPFVINGKLVELRLPLFPRDTPVYAWASEASGGDMATNFEVFTKNLEVSLKNGQPNELIARQLAEYKAVADSIKGL